MLASIDYTTSDVNQSSNNDVNTLISDLNDSRRLMYEHIYYKLLNKGAVGALFKSDEIAARGGCTTRTAYSFLKERESKGEITIQNKGCDGLLITVLKKGWELSKLFKTAFLAYFRDKGLIPFIYTSNTSPPSGVGSNSNLKDKVEKMCSQAGLSEAQTRKVKESLKTVKEIKNLGGLVKHFINKIKDGIMQAVKNSQEIEQEKILDDKLKDQSYTDARAEMQIQGIEEPKKKGMFMTIDELDAFRAYEAIKESKSIVIYNRLRLENGLAKIH